MRKVFAAAITLLTAALAQTVWAKGLEQQIEMRDVAFAPAQVTVHVGDRVAWENGDIVAHTATSKDARFDVNVLPGHRGNALMTRPGTFGYTCRYHPNMKGEIVVES